MQKEAFFGVVLCLLTYAGNAQSDSVSQYHYKKDPSIGIHFSLYDFNSPSLFHQIGFSQTLKGGSLTNIGDMQPGLAISFINGVTNHLDYMIRYTGSFVDYPFPNSQDYGDEYLLSSLDATVQEKLLSDRYWVTPFLSAGVGAFSYKGNFGAYMPLGLGLQVNFFNEAFFFVHVHYQVGVSENAASALYYSLGVAGTIGNGRKR